MVITGLDISVVVTGASSGNGRAIAVGLAAAGASVICADRTPHARSEGFEPDKHIPTHEVITLAGGRSEFVACDVSDRSQVQAAIGTAVQHFGRLDVMVNNAGVFPGLASIFDETDAALDSLLQVNVKGAWNGCKEAALQFRSQGTGGRIINIASVAGLVGVPNEPGYCASKGAVISLTRAVAMDCAQHQISVNAICPGFIKTGMVREFVESEEALAAMRSETPWPRFGEPSDVAGACLMLCTKESEWMTGLALPVDGGFVAH